ncbi:MAG: ATP-binding protein [bacterium]|nr:ATP-binding protein [bacterium]
MQEIGRGAQSYSAKTSTTGVIWKTPRLRFLVFSLPFLLVALGALVFNTPNTLGFIAAGGLVIAAVFIVTSILVGTKTEGEESHQEDQLRSVMLAMQDALVVYDENFNILFFNPAAERLFGVGAGQVMSHPIEPKDANSPSTRRLVQVIFPSLAPSMALRTKTGNYPQIIDLSFELPALELRTITSPVTDLQGRTLGFLKIIRDRTREISVLKSKYEFITVASHQLRTPITNLTWAMESLASTAGFDQPTKEIVDAANIAAKKLRNIVEDLLNVAKIEEGRFGYNFQATDITAFLEKILADFLPETRRFEVKLYFDKPESPLPQVYVDSQRLSMVLINLVDNAIRYNTKAGEIVVAVRALTDKPFIEVTVKDTGIGIPPEEINKLFIKFFRASNAIKYETQGTGLGLYIVQNIVSAHGGQIWAESEVNRGTTFHFTLPTDFALVPPKEVASEY